MCSTGRNDWFGEMFAGFDPDFWTRGWHRQWDPRGPRHRRGRAQMFESGEVKYVILRLLREKPRHGYEIIKELEERFGGLYSPSPGTVYPTLQMLEDQGYVRVVEEEGKRVFHITPEGEAFLDEHRDTVDDILDRVRDTLRQVLGGVRGELNESFARLAGLAYREAWRRGPEDPLTRRIIEILNRATEEIRGLRDQPVK